MNESIGITINLNGRLEHPACSPDTTLLTWLRTKRRLTGTKEGCAEGDCGACTVLLSKPNATCYDAVNSCILSMGQIVGRSVLTVEGLSDKTVHPIQVAMAQNGASQCGFCTPGIVVSLAGLLSNNATPTESEIHDALAGNLCRCTGYKPIVEAAKLVAKSGLIALPKFESISAEILVKNSSGSVFHSPATLKQFFEIRAQHTNATVVAGATDLGVQLAEHESTWPVAISTTSVKELRAITEDDANWHFGAAVNWSEILHIIADNYPSLTVLLRRFGSTQIRNMGTIGGNIGTASPIGDGPPALIALGAIITLASARGEHSMALEDFFIDYRKTALRDDEIIKSVSMPKPVAGQHFRVWKVSKRYDQDISTVCGAFNLIINDGKITSARVAFGGMAATPRRVPTAERTLTGIEISNANFDKTAAAIREAFQPLSDWRGTSAYRSEVAGNLALRLGAELAGENVDVMAEGVKA